MKFYTWKSLLLALLVAATPSSAEITAAGAERAPRKAVVVDEDVPTPPQKPKAGAAADAPSKTAAPKLQIPTKRDEAVRLQIFLDQKFFGPGIIDGKPGLFTKLAIENYNTSLGREKTDMRVVAEAAAGVPEIYATAIIPSFVDKYVDASLPRKRSAQAKKNTCPTAASPSSWPNVITRRKTC